MYVPCYNGATWLERCVDALLAQTHPFAELLVIDDGSTDDSAAIAGRYGPPVHVVPHDGNRGLAVARNTALAAARGEIVAAVDADVCATPDWLGHLLEGFDSPRTAAVGGRLLEAHQERLADRWRASHMAQHSGDLPQLNPPNLPGANVAVRREVIQRLGGYETSFRTNYEDADLKTRLLEVGYRTRYQPAAVAHHLRTDSASSVLRTYWGWLRPPFERRGAFASRAGLLDKLEANAGFASQALWTDFSSGTPQLAYLSLLVLLAFPLADLAHAARGAAARGHSDLPSDFAETARRLPALLPDALATRSTRLASQIASDLTRVCWWQVPPGADPSGGAGAPAAEIASRLRQEVAHLPRAWWYAIEDARDALAAEEGWDQTGGPAGAPGGER